MGYRSDIVMYIKEKDGVDLKELIETSELIEEMGQDCYELGENSNGIKVLRVNFEYIKWYSDFEIVQFWDNVLNTIGEENYLFTRIGEESGDVEISGTYGFAYPITDIDFDVDFIKKNLIENNKKIICCE